MRLFLSLWAAAALGPLALVVWREVYSIHCISLLIPAFVVSIITISIRENALKRRECLAECYFWEASFLYRLLRSKIVITLVAFFLALILCVALLTAVISWDQNMLILLGFDTVILSLVYLRMTRLSVLLGVRESMRPVIAKNWTVSLNIIILLSGGFFIQYYSPVPEYVTCADCTTHTGAIRNASQRIGSECVLVNTIAKLHIEKEAISWWLMIKASQEIENKSFRWVAWILFLVSGTFSAWGYSRLCVQLADFSYRDNANA